MSFLLNIEDEPDTFKYNITEDIKMYDNLLSENEKKTMMALVAERMNGKLNSGHSSVGFHPYTYTHYSTGLSDISFFNTFMLGRIEELTNKKFDILRIYTSLQNPLDYGNFHIDDSCINTYTFTTYCSFSTNSCSKNNYRNIYDEYKINKNKELINTKNSCFEINTYQNLYHEKETDFLKLRNISEKFNEFNINGNFDIKVPGCKDFIHSIPFVENRGLFFPAWFIHNGVSFNSNINRTRCVISFKLKEKSSS